MAVDTIVNRERMAADRMGMQIDEYRRYVQREAKARKKRHGKGSIKSREREPAENEGAHTDRPNIGWGVENIRAKITPGKAAKYNEEPKCKVPLRNLPNCNFCKHAKENCPHVKLGSLSPAFLGLIPNYSSHMEERHERSE